MCSYQLVSEAVEQVSASSRHLCKVMGLPQRDSCPAKTSPSTAEDDQLSSTASSSGSVLCYTYIHVPLFDIHHLLSDIRMCVHNINLVSTKSTV